MAKKDVSKFKEAMLSKTNMIKNEPKKEVQPKAKVDKKETSGEAKSPLSSDVDKKISALAKKQGIDKNELINLGLKFFLEYEKDLFDK